MGDFTQPQQKYAGTGENCNIAIPVIFYPVIKTLFGYVSTQILILEQKTILQICLKLSKNQVIHEISEQF